ncbi:MAG: type II toxin-antitoxin system MqsA family antitoxin [Vicinamibacterales bacterium]
MGNHPAECVLCGTGQRVPGTTTVTLTQGEAVIVFRDVPAEVCDTCGEGYVALDTAAELDRLARAAIEGGVRYAVREYQAA